jgi:hypothetical protein
VGTLHDFWDYEGALGELLQERPGGDFSTDTQSCWAERDWRNVPGPIYTGVTDNCDTGFPEAPLNVLYTEEGREFIARRPRDRHELLCVIHAAACDPFVAYAHDGNDRWTLDLIRGWWSRRDELLRWVQWFHRERAQGSCPSGLAQRLLDFEQFIRNGLREYLVAYAYFLERRRGVADPNVLPEID